MHTHMLRYQQNLKNLQIKKNLSFSDILLIFNVQNIRKIQEIDDTDPKTN